jgi:hypothetical protein
MRRKFGGQKRAPDSGRLQSGSGEMLQNHIANLGHAH